MKPIIVYDSTLCKMLTMFGGYSAITLMTIIFFKRVKEKVKQDDITHETTHSLQQFEMIMIGIVISILLGFIIGFNWWLISIPLLLFYVIYGLEYIIALPFNKFMNNDSYHTISFEEEAYENEDNINYPNERKWFSWIKYLGNVKRKG